MPCDLAQTTQAYLDGELDAAEALAHEKHLECCAECQALKNEIETVRALVREKATYHRADPKLKRKIVTALGKDAPRSNVLSWPRSVWTAAASSAAATALAASLAFFLFLPPASESVISDITDAHLRSLASAHLIDVASSDRHTVKPWLATHADLSPPVADFSRQGFTLVGGRVDFLAGQRTAVTVYRHGAHIVNVFAWANHEYSLPDFATRNGYHIVFWTRGNLTFCAISDTAVDDIVALSELLKGLSQTDARE